jgi:hypothetical protein
MSEHEQEEQGGLAVPGPESHESEETLSPDERGAAQQPVPPPSRPKEPARAGGSSLWSRIRSKLQSRG